MSNKTKAELKAIAYDKFMDAAEVGGVDLKVSALTLSAVFHAELSIQNNRIKKEEYNMKTVIDAVIEYEAIAPEPCYAENKDQIIMAAKSFDGYLLGDLTTGDGVRDNEYWKVICTREQFKALVDELSTNFGRSTQTYAEYKKEFEYMTTPAIDYTSKEFWKDAPDGATGHSEDNEYYEECWYKNITSESFYCMTVSSGIWIHSFDTWQLKRRGVITRPKPQPVFTQAMADAGELPSVGMECILSISEFAAIHSQDKSYNGHHCEIVAHIDTLAVAIVRDENSDVCFTITANHTWFKPIDTRAEKEKAIDDYISQQHYGLDSLSEHIKTIMSDAFNAGVTWSGDNE